MTPVWIAALQLLGLALLLAEVFLPSFGLFGLAMAASLGGSLWLAWGSGSWFWGLLAADLVAFPALGWFLLERIGPGPMGHSQHLESGSPDNLELHMGRSGVAETDLRPAGKARFGNEILDVVSDGRFLARGCALRIVDTRQNRIVVRATEPEDPTRALGE